MSHKTAKIGITTLVLLGALGGLLYSTMAEGMEYYKHVNEVMTAPDQWYGKRLQLHGFVKDGTYFVSRDSLRRRFTVEYAGSTINAEYTGIVPDTFKEGAEVVIKGTLGPKGFTVEPNGIMAKCPSKYEAKPGAVGGRAPTAGTN